MDKPWIEKVSPSLGINEALVFVNGYLTENCTEPYHHNDLMESLRQSGYKGAIYYLWWDSSNKQKLYGAISQFGIGVLPHFEKHKKRAKRVGKFSFENLILLEVLESEVSLIGHSLGARVIYYCGINWSSHHSRKLKSVFLLGGAIARNAKWEQITSCCKDSLYNIYNSKDPILLKPYRLQSLGKPACGSHPIRKKSERMHNIDVVTLIGRTHNLQAYLECLPSLVAQRVLNFE